MQSMRVASLLLCVCALAACGDRGPGFNDDRRSGTDVIATNDAVDDLNSTADTGGGDMDSAVDKDVPAVGDDVPVGRDTVVIGRDTAMEDVPPLPPMVDILAPGAPSDAAARFGGAADMARAPALVYPTDGTIVPANLSGLEVHFTPGAGNALFEVSFVGDASTVRVYTTCTAVGGGCALVLDDTTFNTIARASRPSDQVRISVRGTGASGGTVGTSSARTLGITSTNLRGGIYYWSAAAGNIMRYEFGLPGARAELYVGGGGPFACVGCHVLSRDGTRTAIGRFIPGPSTMQTYDVATRATVGTTYASNFATFSPDSSRLLISDGVRMALLDTATGAGATGLTAGTLGSMPDWSPDGAHVVYSLPNTSAPFGGSPGHSAPADLRVMPYASGAFGASSVLVHSSGENNYYPSYSPDGAWVLFNRSAGESYNVIDARLFAVRGTGGTPLHLANADGVGDLGNSWPKWAPFVELYRGEPLMWLTFASRRDYGLRLQQQSRAADMRTSQLWMAAFRPFNAEMGDPSAPAFWLPVQSLSEGNHIAQWTQEVRRHNCTRDADCMANETCRMLVSAGVCVGR